MALTAPSPVFALRPAGLEENDKAKVELMNALMKAARLPAIEDLALLVTALDDHPGGEIKKLEAVREFLSAKRVPLVGMTTTHLEVAVESQNRRRLAANVVRRATEAAPALRPLLVTNPRLRILNYLQQFPGGALSLETLAEGAGYATIYQLYPNHHQATGFDFHEVIAADNALRLEANVARRGADLPLLSLTAVGRDAVDTLLLDALQRSRGGYLSVKELAGDANTGRAGWHAHDDAGRVAAENARRRRANVLRRAQGKPPIPRVAHTAALALRYALEDWWEKAPPTREQIIRFANISHGHFKRHFVTALPVANANRAAHHLPPLPSTLAAGLEEQTAARWRQLIEGRTERGIVVVPAIALAQFAGLEEFLADLPPALAADVVLWGENQAARELFQKDPVLPFVREPSVQALGRYLQGRRAAEAALLNANDPSWFRSVRTLVATYQVELTNLPRFDLTEFLSTLGVPAPVSQQVGVEELVSQRYVASGT